MPQDKPTGEAPKTNGTKRRADGTNACKLKILTPLASREPDIICNLKSLRYAAGASRMPSNSFNSSTLSDDPACS